MKRTLIALVAIGTALLLPLAAISAGQDGTGTGLQDESQKSVDSSGSGERPSGDSARILEITRGKEVDLKAHLVPGKTTIVDFFSPFCPPCMKLNPHLEAMVEARDDMALRLVNINRDGVEGIDWTAPVVAQYGISGVPHFKLFSPAGDLVAEGQEAYEKVYELISDFRNKKKQD